MAKGEKVVKFGFWPFIIVAVLAAVVGALVPTTIQRVFTPAVKLDTTSVSERLEECQDLVTAKLDYRGLVRYEEGDIDFINKKAFTMIYDAQVSAGVDLSQAKVTVSGREVQVTLPAATVKSIEIDPDSLEFYDEKFALFNWQDRADTAEALKLAQKDAEAKVDESDLISTASKQAKTVVETLLKPLQSDNDPYTVNVTVG